MLSNCTSKFDKDFWVIIIAGMSLIASVIIPFAAKKYEQWKSKTSFHLYLKKFFGITFNISTYDLMEYFEPSIKDDPKKLKLGFSAYLKRFQEDLKTHQNTVQPRVGFALLINLQNLLMVTARIRQAIIEIDVGKLYEQTLAYGNSLNKKELHRIYGILLLMEHFSSITIFHDRFADMKSIQRIVKDNRWVGLKLEHDFLHNQNLIGEDLKHLSNNESSIDEIIKICKLLIQELKSYFDYEKLQAKKGKQK